MTPLNSRAADRHPLGALYRVVLLESVLPLLAATLLAAVVGFTIILTCLSILRRTTTDNIRFE